MPGSRVTAEMSLSLASMEMAETCRLGRRFWSSRGPSASTDVAFKALWKPSDPGPRGLTNNDAWSTSAYKAIWGYVGQAGILLVVYIGSWRHCWHVKGPCSRLQDQQARRSKHQKSHKRPRQPASCTACCPPWHRTTLPHDGTSEEWTLFKAVEYILSGGIHVPSLKN